MSACQKRRQEEMKPLRITSQTKLCCKILLCCLDIIKVKIGRKPYYKNGSNCPWPVWLTKLVGALSHASEGHGFNSESGQIPWLQD